MTVEYTETIAPDDDAEGRVLDSLADGEPYAFCICRVGEDGSLGLRVASNVGAETIKSILRKTLDALP